MNLAFKWKEEMVGFYNSTHNLWLCGPYVRNLFRVPKAAAKVVFKVTKKPHKKSKCFSLLNYTAILYGRDNEETLIRLDCDTAITLHTFFGDEKFYASVLKFE